jgi:hypothetical protein
MFHGFGKLFRSKSLMTPLGIIFSTPAAELKLTGHYNRSIGIIDTVVFSESKAEIHCHLARYKYSTTSWS